MKDLRLIYVFFVFLVIVKFSFALEEPSELDKQRYEALIVAVEKEFFSAVGEEWRPKSERGKDTEQFLTMIGNWLENRGYFEAAVYHYSNFVKEYPDDPWMIDRMYVYIGSAYRRAGNYRKAIEVYTEFLQKHGEDERVCNPTPTYKKTLGFLAKKASYKSIAECYKQLGEYSTAIEYYKKTIEFINSELAKIKNPDIPFKNLTPEEEKEFIMHRDFWFQMDIADCLKGLKEYKKALEIYKGCKQFVEEKGYPKNWDKKRIEYWKKEDAARLSKSIAECERLLSEQAH